MLRRPSFVALISLAALLGCAVHPGAPNPTTPAATYLNLTGDWTMLAGANLTNPAALPTPIASFMGALQSTEGTVTGTLHAFDPNFTSPCIALTADLSATGTLDTTGNLTLTVPLAGGSAVLRSQFATNLQTFTPGTWTITGGACAMPATIITLTQIAPITGTYTGTLNVLNLTTNTPVPGTATTVTATLTQSTTPNADGQFPLTGSITATGACTGTFPLTNMVVQGGGLLQLPSIILTNPPAAILSGAANPTATILTGGVSAFFACGFNSYFGTLTRQ